MIRLGKVTIHPTGLLLVGFVIYCCFEQNTIMPLVWLSVALGVGLPACYYVHKWNEQENKKIAQEDTNFFDEVKRKFDKK